MVDAVRVVAAVVVAAGVALVAGGTANTPAPVTAPHRSAIDVQAVTGDKGYAYVTASKELSRAVPWAWRD
jgi:hypothetical protein